MRQTGVTQRQGVVGELADGGDVRLTLGERERHALELGDLAAERLPLLGVGPRFIEGRLRGADTLQRDQRAAVVKTSHDFGEAFAFGADAMTGRHANVVEEHRAAPDDSTANIIEAAAAQAFCVCGNKERRDAVGTLFWCAGTREDQECIGAVGKRDRGFLAGEDIVAAAVAARAQSEVGGV